MEDSQSLIEAGVGRITGIRVWRKRSCALEAVVMIVKDLSVSNPPSNLCVASWRVSKQRKAANSKSNRRRHEATTTTTTTTTKRTRERRTMQCRGDRP